MFTLLKVKDHTNISQQKIFWKNQTFSNLFGSEKLVIAIMTIMAIKTIMDIKTNMSFSEIKSSIECKELIPG